MEGRVITYNQKNINTDLIIPARYLLKETLNFLAIHCMEDLDPEFVEKVKKNNYSILVAGSNFGCGSSREQAPLALKASGIKCVVSPSFARIFFRNAINIGLQIVELPTIENINTGNILEIDFKKGELVNKTSQLRHTIKKQPNFLQEIISEEGLVNYAKKKLV